MAPEKKFKNYGTSITNVLQLNAPKTKIASLWTDFALLTAAWSLKYIDI